MASGWSQILAGLTGGFQGYGQQEEKKFQRQRQAVNDARAETENASQRALREAQLEALRNPPETWGGEYEVREDNGQDSVMVRSNKGNTKRIGGVIPKVVAPVRDYAKEQRDQWDYELKHPKPVQPQQPSFTPVTFDNGDGAPPVIKPFNTRDGTVGGVLGNAKAPTTRIESATNTAAKARLEAGISELNNAHGGMSQYEQDLASGKVNISGLSQFLSRSANTFSHDDPVSMGLQSAALTALNGTNPELARYIRRGLSFAEGESMISQRPSDYRTKLAAFLSMAATHATPDMIADIQSRRNSILAPLNRIKATDMPSRAGGPGPATPQRRSTDPEPDAVKPDFATRARELKGLGYSKDEVRAQLQKEGIPIPTVP